MNHGINFELLHDVLGKAHIMDIALNQLHIIGHSLFMTSGKIIINDGSEATFLQLLHHMGANISGTAGNENIHKHLPLFYEHSRLFYKS